MASSIQFLACCLSPAHTAGSPPCPPCPQKSGWTRKLPQILPWLQRSSPYYNLISDESQIWQGEPSGVN